MKTDTRNLAIILNEDKNAIVSINNFDQQQMGFYTCLSMHSSSKEEKTILLTTGKLVLHCYFDKLNL